MTFLHTLRQVAFRAGLDVQRAQATGPARIAGFLHRHGVDCVLDVGANRGQYGRQLRHFGYVGQIHSFEPVPETYRSLAKAASGDPRWSTWRLALGREDGILSMNIAGNEAAASSSALAMLPRHVAAAPGVGYVDTVEVPVRRLDAIWDDTVPDDAGVFIKLDVQGFEGAVMDGATESLRQIVGLQVEMSLAPLYEGALSAREMLERTEELDMQMVDVERGFADPQTGELLQIDGVFFRKYLRMT